VLGRAVVLAAALEGHRQVLAGLVLAGAQAANARQTQAQAAERTRRGAARRSADSLRDRA
jgi:hypothetical protein